MSRQFDFRAVLLKIQDLLSQKDRQSLIFLMGEDIPRYLQDDPSFKGTLNVFQSLFDKSIISYQDCDYLIEAFGKIHCDDAAKRLKRLFFLFSSCNIYIYLSFRVSKKSGTTQSTKFVNTRYSFERQ